MRRGRGPGDTAPMPDRFAQPLPVASQLILPAYWAAQWLIARSLPPRT